MLSVTDEEAGCGGKGEDVAREVIQVMQKVMAEEGGNKESLEEAGNEGNAVG